MFQRFHHIFNQHKTLYTTPYTYSGAELLKQLGIQPGAPVMVFNGGETQGQGQRALEHIIHEGVARAAAELRATVLDGGVDTGLFSLLNAALRARLHHGHYIGVAPEALTRLPNQPHIGYRLPLGDAHTHFVLVDGEHWGVEIPTLNALTFALAEKTSYLRIMIKRGKETEEQGIAGKKDERPGVPQNGHLSDKISLQLCFPVTAQNSNLEKMTREDVYSVAELDLEPDKLANRIKYFLNAYSPFR